MNLSDIEFGKTRVTHTNFDSGEGTVTAEASGLYVEGQDRVLVKWDTPARHLSSTPATHQVGYLEAVSPAPLDPSKVKQGDIVTLEHPDGSRIVDRKVSSVHAVMVGKRQEYLNDLYTAGFTLADHQPKPRWKPGTRGTGTINGHKISGLVSEMNGTTGLYYWNDFTGRTSYTGTIPEDFTPDAPLDAGNAREALALTGLSSAWITTVVRALGLDRP